MIGAVMDVLTKSAKSDTNLVMLSLVDITALSVGLSAYLFWVGFLLHRIAGNLEIAADIVSTINGHAELITPAVEHIINTGGIIAGALPLLYNMAEGIVKGVSTKPSGGEREFTPNRPASGRRRSRMHDAIGYS